MTEEEAQQQQATKANVEGETADVEMPEAALIEASGGRARRSTQKFGFDDHKPEEEEEAFTPPVGDGVKVRDMEAIAEKISHMGKKDAETIKSLYNIMYGRRFQQKNIRTIKDHILDFSGIPNADEKMRQQLVGKMGRWMRSYVQDIMDLLGVDRSKKSFDEENKPFDKDALIGRLIDWLCNPQEPKNAKRKATPATKKKKTASTTKAAAGTKRKSAATTKKPAKKAKTAAKKKSDKKAVEEVEDEEDATESEVDKANDEDDGSGDSDSDFGEDAKKSKSTKKKTPTKRAPKKATPRRNKKSSAVVESEDEADDATEEDEKPKVSTNALGADVRKKVEDIIANGDAEQLTVKKIVRQLSEDMGKDFSDQKAAIKDFVTNLQM